MIRVEHLCDRPMIRKLCGGERAPFCAETVGFAFWKTIRTGEIFAALPCEQAMAVIAHEIGHIVHWHIEKRMLWLVTGRAFFDTAGFLALCEAQEMEADAYAAAKGHGPALLALLARMPDNKIDGYPTPKERIERLKCLVS